MVSVNPPDSRSARHRRALRSFSGETARVTTWLEHLGEAKAAARLMQAIEAVTAKRIFTPDLGGRASTRKATNALLARLSRRVSA